MNTLTIKEFANTLTIKGQIRQLAVEVFVNNIQQIEQKTGQKNALRKLVEDTMTAKFGKNSGSNVWSYLVKLFKDYISKPEGNRTANWSMVISNTALVTDKWAIINKETREVVGYAPSKNKAFKAKTENETVKETVKL